MASTESSGWSGVPRLMIAAPGAGAGKTTAVVALCRALRARGLGVATFKCGQPSIDLGYHARATGRSSHILDPASGHDGVLAAFGEAAGGADLALVEGAGGLFDGAGASTESGSSAEIALWLEAPVLLVVDVSAMARSVAALVHGFRTYDPRLEIAGVLASRVASREHLELVRAALGIPPLLGGLPEERGHSFRERDVGLKMLDHAGEVNVTEATLDHWGNVAREWMNLDAIVASAGASRLRTVAADGG